MGLRSAQPDTMKTLPLLDLEDQVQAGLDLLGD